MVQFAAVSALLLAAMLGGAGAWWLSSRRPRRTRQRGQRARYGFDEQTAVWRHPAGRARWPEREQRAPSGQAAPPRPRSPVGPDDDPEFINALERLIRGERGEPS